MALNKRTYIANTTKITAANLNEIQDAVIDLESKKITVDSALSTTSTNPVQNKVIDARLIELSYGNPIDATADYQNFVSNTSVSKDRTPMAWACATSAIDATKFRVAKGQYIIDEEDGYAYIISIFDSPLRFCKVVRFSEDGSDTIQIGYYYRESPRNTEGCSCILFIDYESGTLHFNTDAHPENNLLLPRYYSSTDSNNGKFLRINSKGEPEWQSLTNVAEEGA